MIPRVHSLAPSLNACTISPGPVVLKFAGCASAATANNPRKSVLITNFCIVTLLRYRTEHPRVAGDIADDEESAGCIDSIGVTLDLITLERAHRRHLRHLQRTQFLELPNLLRGELRRQIDRVVAIQEIAAGQCSQHLQ